MISSDAANPSLIQHWAEIRNVFKRSFGSSFHYAIASVNADGTPHNTPIGSLLLHNTEPKGIYFEIFTSQLRKNIETNPNISVLAVDSGIWFWLKSLTRGEFPYAPAIRLYGKAGERRAATDAEINRFKNRIKFVRELKGAKMLWGDLRQVREVIFFGFEHVKMGRMTGRLHT